MKSIDRRNFLSAAVVAGSAAMIGGALSGCTPKRNNSGSTLGATGAGAENVNWDEEFDIVVCGSGTALVGALTAQESEASVVVLEKGSTLGGTTVLSGAVCWVPSNHVMERFGYGPDISDEEVLDYMRSADVSHGSSDETKLDYIQNARKLFRWMEDTWGLEFGIFPATCDYYDLPGAMGLGRSIGFIDSQTEAAGGAGMDDVAFQEVFIGMAQNRGLDMRTNAEVTSLVQNSDGRIVGVEAHIGSETKYIKAAKGVLLGTGGFEHNKEMCDKYLYGPLHGLASPSTNTGDGQRMGQRVGADLANMSSVWGNPFYLISDEPAQNPLADYGMYAGTAGAIYVNSRGRRFVNEAAGYDVVTNAFYNYDTYTYSFGNMPAWLIFDSDHAEAYGWPTYVEEQPKWVKAFSSIDELANACGIDPEGLTQEIARFNAMCENGVDEDFGRGTWLHDTIQAECFGPRPDLANVTMGPIATPPFYAVKVGPGAFGTNGGLAVDTNARVLDLDGKAIEGLYACGNCAASICGSIYPGPGGTVGPGFYQAFRAVNHALELGII